MRFKDITAKLGNMRKEVSWVLYPQEQSKPNEIIIQCDARIALIDLEKKKGLLSSGKGGHNGFVHLQPALGAKVVDVPDNIIEQLKKLLEKPNVSDQGVQQQGMVVLQS